MQNKGFERPNPPILGGVAADKVVVTIAIKDQRPLQTIRDPKSELHMVAANEYDHGLRPG